MATTARAVADQEPTSSPADLVALTTARGPRAMIPQLLARSPHHRATDIDTYALYEHAAYEHARRTTVAARLGQSPKQLRDTLSRLGAAYGDSLDPDDPYHVQPQWLITDRTGPHSWKRLVIEGTSRIAVPAAVYGNRTHTPDQASGVSAQARRVYINLRGELRRQGATGIVTVALTALACWSRLTRVRKRATGYAIGDALAELETAGWIVRHQRCGGMWLIVPLWQRADEATRKAVAVELARVAASSGIGQAVRATPSSSGTGTPSSSGTADSSTPGLRPTDLRPRPVSVQGSAHSSGPPRTETNGASVTSGAAVAARRACRDQITAALTTYLRHTSSGRDRSGARAKVGT